MEWYDVPNLNTALMSPKIRAFYERRHGIKPASSLSFSTANQPTVAPVSTDPTVLPEKYVPSTAVDAMVNPALSSMSFAGDTTDLVLDAPVRPVRSLARDAYHAAKGTGQKDIAQALYDAKDSFLRRQGKAVHFGDLWNEVADDLGVATGAWKPGNELARFAVGLPGDIALGNWTAGKAIGGLLGRTKLGSAVDVAEAGGANLVKTREALDAAARVHDVAQIEDAAKKIAGITGREVKDLSITRPTNLAIPSTVDVSLKSQPIRAAGRLVAQALGFDMPSQATNAERVAAAIKSKTDELVAGGMPFAQAREAAEDFASLGKTAAEQYARGQVSPLQYATRATGEKLLSAANAVDTALGKPVKRMFVATTGNPVVAAFNLARRNTEAGARMKYQHQVQAMDQIAKEEGITDFSPAASLREMPFEEQVDLLPLTRRAYKVLKSGMKRFKMKPLDLAEIRRARDAALAQGNVPAATAIDAQIADIVRDPIDAHLNALERVASAEPKPPAKMLAEINAVLSARKVLADKILSGQGTPRAIPPGYEELVRRQGEPLFEAMFADAKAIADAGGKASPEKSLRGYGLQYAPHVVTEDFQKWREMVKAKRPDLLQHGIEVNAQSPFQKQRDLFTRGLPIEEINRDATTGVLKTYAGTPLEIDLGGGQTIAFPGKVLEDNPIIYGDIRGLVSAKNQGAQAAMNELLKAHDPTGVELVSQLGKEMGAGLPRYTRKSLEGLKLPQEVAEYLGPQLVNVSKPFKMEEFLLPATRYWKSMATSTPGFVVRNTIGAQEQGSAMGYTDPLTGLLQQVRAGQLLTDLPLTQEARKVFSATHGRELSGDELLTEAARQGVVGSTAWSPHEFGPAKKMHGLPESIASAVGDSLAARGWRMPVPLQNVGEAIASNRILNAIPRAINRTVLNPMDDPAVVEAIKTGGKGAIARALIGDAIRQTPFIGDMNPISRFVRASGDLTENAARIGMFRDLIQQGMPVERAGQKVARAFIDYGNKTDLERAAFNTLVPFGKFATGNVATQVAAAVGNPKGVLTRNAILQAIAEAMDPDNPSVAQFAKEQNPFGINIGAGTRSLPDVSTGALQPAYVQAALDNYLPSLSLAADTATLAGGSGERALSMVTPFLTALVLNMGLNKNIRSGKPIDRFKEAFTQEGTRDLGIGMPSASATLAGVPMPNLGLASPKQIKEAIRSLEPGIAVLDRLNPGGIFGEKKGEAGLLGYGAPRDVQDLPATDRYLRYLGQLPIQQTADEMSQIVVRNNIRKAISAIRMQAQEIEKNQGPGKGLAWFEQQAQSKWLKELERKANLFGISPLVPKSMEMEIE